MSLGMQYVSSSYRSLCGLKRQVGTWRVLSGPLARMPALVSLTDAVRTVTVQVPLLAEVTVDGSRVHL